MTTDSKDNAIDIDEYLSGCEEDPELKAVLDEMRKWVKNVLIPKLKSHDSTIP